MKSSTLLVLVPLSVLAALFALANRQEVVVILDLLKGEGALSLAMPLYLLVFLALFAGVLLGGATVALGRGSAQKKRLKANEIGNAIVRLDAQKPRQDGTEA